MYHTKEFFVSLLCGYQGLELQNLREALDELNIIGYNDLVKKELRSNINDVIDDLDDIKYQIENEL